MGDGCYNVLASAGSGKTRVLVGRIGALVEEYGVPPENILAITYSKAAKENMISRLRDTLAPNLVTALNVETFHSFGYRLLRSSSRGSFHLLTKDSERARIIEDILTKQCGIRKPVGSKLPEAMKYISCQKNSMILPKKKRGSGDWLEKAYCLYEERKFMEGMMDFDDMLTGCYKLLTNNKDVLDFCQEKYKYILADEMQDTNVIQYEIMKLIGTKHRNIFIVSDPMQSIYGFRGSDNRFVLNFDQDWPEAETIHLNTNYRSGKEIVEMSNHFARCLPESNHPHYVESVADCGSMGSPRYKRLSDDEQEAEWISDHIEELGTTYRYQDMAILTRTNAQMQNIELALFNRGIPYKTAGNHSFVDRMEIQTVNSYLKLKANRDDNAALAYIYNKPSRYLGEAYWDRVIELSTWKHLPIVDVLREAARWFPRARKGVESLLGILGELSSMRYDTVGDLIRWLRKELNLDTFIAQNLCDADENRIDNLDALERFAGEYNDLNEYLNFMKQVKTAQTGKSDAVNLLTIHKSKGLEYPVVFIAGLNQGMLPHYRSEDINEEKRLMYVAMTRAEQKLYISSSMEYMGRKTDESEFIQLIFGKTTQTKRRNGTKKETKKLCVKRTRIE